MERTLVLIKPDGVRRKLVGRIISRFEEVGFELQALKLVQATKELVGTHYADDPEWLSIVGGKTLEAYEEYGLDPMPDLGTTDAEKIGRIIRDRLIDYVTSGPVVAMIIAGNRAVPVVRKIVGNTIPAFAEAGTIRGDLSADSPDRANAEQRPIQNLIHASGAVDEAEHEIKLWFPEEAG